MTARGRPLWFLATIMGGWTAARVVALWPAPPPVDARSLLPQAEPAFRPIPSPSPAIARGSPPAGDAVASIAPARRGTASGRSAGMPADGVTAPAATAPPPSPNPSIRPAAAPPPDPPPPATIAGTALAGETARSSRLHGDAYLVARGGREGSLAFGELGASQAGARLTYAIGAARRLALSARIAAPLHDTGREAAAGLDWQPTRLPVHLLVEDRYGLDTKTNAPAAELIAGVYRRAPLGLTLDAYAQGGAVLRRGPFVDGAARLFRTTPLAPHLRLELGAGGWGGAQRGAARLDLGPSASLALAGRGRAGLRLGADYRIRVAGGASPGSGPALTLGAGF